MARFMVTSLSNFVDNPIRGIHKIKKVKIVIAFLKMKVWRTIEYKCLSCNKSYSKKIDEELKKRFKYTFMFSNNDINKFMLLLRKGVYPYEYMDE